MNKNVNIKDLKEKLHKYISENKIVEEKNDEISQINQFYNRKSRDNINLGKSFLSVIKGFERQNYHPMEVFSEIDNLVSEEIPKLARISKAQDSAIKILHRSTTTIAGSSATMAMGLDLINAYFKENQQIPQVHAVFEQNKDLLTSTERLNRLREELKPFNFSLKLDNIL